VAGLTSELAERLPTVSVVIPTRDRLDVIERTLSGVLADPATTEVLVMLDHGTPGRVSERIAAFAKREPRVKVRQPPVGAQDLWSVQHARDVGADEACSEVILALDDDVVAEPGMVTGHARLHSDRKGIVAAGYMPVATVEPWPRSNAPIRFYSDAYQHHCQRYEAEPESLLLSLWGGNVSVRRSDWLEAIKRPRTRCWGHDDQELGLLFLRAGLVGVFDPRLRAQHWYRRSLTGFVVRAEQSAQSQARLRAANLDLLEQSDPRASRLLEPLVFIARSSMGWFLIKSIAICLIAAASALRLSAIEYAGAIQLWNLATQHSLRRFRADT